MKIKFIHIAVTLILGLQIYGLFFKNNSVNYPVTINETKQYYIQHDSLKDQLNEKFTKIDTFTDTSNNDSLFNFLKWRFSTPGHK